MDRRGALHLLPEQNETPPLHFGMVQEEMKVVCHVADVTYDEPFFVEKNGSSV